MQFTQNFCQNNAARKTKLHEIAHMSAEEIGCMLEFCLGNCVACASQKGQDNRQVAGRLTTPWIADPKSGAKCILCRPKLQFAARKRSSIEVKSRSKGEVVGKGCAAN